MRNNIALIFLLTFILLPLHCFSALPKTLDTNSESNALRTLLLEHGYKELPLALSKDKNFLLIYASLDGKQIGDPFILDTGSTLSSFFKFILIFNLLIHGGGKSITAGGGAVGLIFALIKLLFQKYRSVILKHIIN